MQLPVQQKSWKFQVCDVNWKGQKLKTVGRLPMPCKENYIMNASKSISVIE